MKWRAISVSRVSHGAFSDRSLQRSPRARKQESFQPPVRRNPPASEQLSEASRSLVKAIIFRPFLFHKHPRTKNWPSVEGDRTAILNIQSPLPHSPRMRCSHNRRMRANRRGGRHRRVTTAKAAENINSFYFCLIPGRLFERSSVVQSI